MIETEQTRKAQARRKARLRQRSLEFARIYIDKGVSANEPDAGPFMMPSYGIFEDDPQVRALIMEDDCSIPFTEERYERIEGVIAEGVVKYNIHARRDLARIHGLFLLSGQSEEETDENVVKPFLARATTVFHMDYQTAPECVSYETLTEMLHLALVYWEPRIGEPPKWGNIIPKITPDVLAGKITRELLRVAGAPENSTWERMERICRDKLVCTCRKPGFEQPAWITTLVSILSWAFFVSVSEEFTCLQVLHIRNERTWARSSEAERWRDEGLEDPSSHIDHAVSEIHNFVKVLPEGMMLNTFMRSQPPLLGGTVGDLSEVRNRFSTLALILGFAPPLEGRRFVCEHCGKSMTKEYLVWHMNAKYVASIFTGPCGVKTYWSCSVQA